MQVNLKSDINVFMPVKIELVFHDQRALDAFGTLFNHASVVQALQRIGFLRNGSESLRRAVQDSGGDIHNLIDKLHF